MLPSTALFRSVLVVSALVSYSIAGAQVVAMKDYAAAQRQLDQELAPLKGLNEKETRAVAALVLASRVGFDVTDYCPPLRQFDVPERVPCLGAIAAYASAEKECKVANPTPTQCPKLFEAEANWMSCDMRRLESLLRDIKTIRPGPWPKPRPYGDSLPR